MPGLKITLLQQPLVWMDGPANLRHFDRQLEGITGRDVIVLARQGVFPSCSLVAIDCLIIFVEQVGYFTTNCQVRGFR